MADPILQPATVPGDASLPDTPQRLVNFIASYLQIQGLADLGGLIISETEPGVADRDKVWVKVDPANSRAVGLFRYLGGWQAIPCVPLSGEVEPANPRPGEVFYNTKAKALKSFLDGAWTTELWHKGVTSDRPTSAPVGYLFFDTTIKRLLRYTAQGWSTVDGAIGELRMYDGVSVSEAEERNPGWAVLNAFAGRFPIGQSDEYSVGEEGGRDKVPWSAKSLSAQGGGRDQGCITEISIDNKTLTASTGTSVGSKSEELSILPPYRAVIFLRKEY